MDVSWRYNANKSNKKYNANKSDGKGQKPYDFTHMWNIKWKVRNKVSKQNKNKLKTQEYEWRLPKGKGRMGRVKKGQIYYRYIVRYTILYMDVVL